MLTRSASQRVRAAAGACAGSTGEIHRDNKNRSRGPRLRARKELPKIPVVTTIVKVVGFRLKILRR
jgi:hypothetical protein